MNMQLSENQVAESGTTYLRPRGLYFYESYVFPKNSFVVHGEFDDEEEIIFPVIEEETAHSGTTIVQPRCRFDALNDCTVSNPIDTSESYIQRDESEDEVVLYECNTLDAEVVSDAVMILKDDNMLNCNIIDHTSIAYRSPRKRVITCGKQLLCFLVLVMSAIFLVMKDVALDDRHAKIKFTPEVFDPGISKHEISTLQSQQLQNLPYELMNQGELHTSHGVYQGIYSEGNITGKSLSNSRVTDYHTHRDVLARIPVNGTSAVYRGASSVVFTGVIARRDLSRRPLMRPIREIESSTLLNDSSDFSLRLLALQLRNEIQMLMLGDVGDDDQGDHNEHLCKLPYANEFTNYICQRENSSRHLANTSSRNYSDDRRNLGTFDDGVGTSAVTILSLLVYIFVLVVFSRMSYFHYDGTRNLSVASQEFVSQEDALMSLDIYCPDTVFTSVSSKCNTVLSFSFIT